MTLNRIIILITAVFVATAAFSQKQLTIIDEENGESFEVTVPDGLKIYEYNENRLDSIPYLMEHVRNREPWAYENLARCYRYGIGIEKSIVNAMVYYGKAGINERELAESAYRSDPTDELGFMHHLMEELDENRMTIEEALALLNSYTKPLPDWAACMKRIFENRNIEDLDSSIKSLDYLDTSTADELFAIMTCQTILKPDAPTVMSRPSSPDFMDNLSIFAEKIPVIYMVAGTRYRNLYEDCPGNEQAMRNAFELYHKAYLYGLLEEGGAIEVLDFRDNNQLYQGFPFSDEELAHLDSFYSKEYRIRFKSPCVVEECVVEEMIDNE